jgi:hypothetical protein
MDWNESSQSCSYVTSMSKEGACNEHRVQVYEKDKRQGAPQGRLRVRPISIARSRARYGNCVSSDGCCMQKMCFTRSVLSSTIKTNQKQESKGAAQASLKVHRWAAAEGHLHGACCVTKGL